MILPDQDELPSVFDALDRAFDERYGRMEDHKPQPLNKGMSFSYINFPVQPLEAVFGQVEENSLKGYGSLPPLSASTSSDSTPSGSYYAPAIPASASPPSKADQAMTSRIAKVSAWVSSNFGSPSKSDKMDTSVDERDADAEETATVMDGMDVDAEPQEVSQEPSMWTVGTTDTEEEQLEEILQMARVPSQSNFGAMEDDQEEEEMHTFALHDPYADDEEDSYSEDSSVTASPPNNDDEEIVLMDEEPTQPIAVRGMQQRAPVQQPVAQGQTRLYYGGKTIPGLFPLAFVPHPPVPQRKSSRVVTPTTKLLSYASTPVSSPSKKASPLSNKATSPSKKASSSSKKAISPSKPASSPYKATTSPSKTPKSRTPRRARNVSPSPSKRKGKSPALTVATSHKPKSHGDLRVPLSPSKPVSRAWFPPFIPLDGTGATDGVQHKCGVEGCGGTMGTSDAEIDAHLAGHAHAKAPTECGWVIKEGERCEHSIREKSDDSKERLVRHIATAHLPRNMRLCSVCKKSQFAREEQIARHAGSCKVWKEIKASLAQEVSECT